MTPDLLDLVLERDELADLDPAERRLALRSLVAEAVSAERIDGLVAELADAVDGYGPVGRLLRDDAVTDVLVNRWDDVWVERAGRLERTDVSFADEAHLRAFIERAIGAAGRRVDASHPISDASLPDGSRIHAVLPPVAPEGAVVSIRRFPHRPLSLDDLVAARMLDAERARLLIDSVQGGLTIGISGGTGSGKTTLLNALLGLVPASQRVVLVEETSELRPLCAHWVSLLCREANAEGRGRVDQTTLLRAALRMRPDRIVVGEVRGPEALVALAAMSTGHEGSMVTVHARSGARALERMVALALQAGSGASEDSLRHQVLDAFDLVVHLSRDERGIRRIESVTRVDGRP